MFRLLRINTLDRYIIRKYLSTFGFSLLICSMISMVIDFSDKVKSFIEKPCTTSEILFDYFPGFVFNITGLLLPLYTMIAVVFFTSRMAYNSEVISVFSAGVSFNRLLRPYIMAACVVAAGHFLLNHFVVPRANKERLKFERTYVWTTQEKVRNNNVHFLVAPDVKVQVQGYHKENQTASGLRLEKFEGNRVISILSADLAQWQDSVGKWRLPSHQVRTFDGLREHLARTAEQKDTAFNLTPQDFIWYHNQNEEMTSLELRAAIARERSRGLSFSKNYEIELNRRTSDAFTNIILTIIGLAVAGRKVRGGMGLHLAIGIGVGALFILLSKFSVSFATSGMVPVALGMWIPNIVFSLVAIWLIARAQK